MPHSLIGSHWIHGKIVEFGAKQWRANVNDVCFLEKKNSEAIKMTFGSSVQKVPFDALVKRDFNSANNIYYLIGILENAEYIL